MMRKPDVSSIDGLRVDLYQIGVEYDVGNSLAAVMLAEGWAVPVPLEQPPAAPPNLTREYYPPSFKDFLTAADSEPRRRKTDRER